MMCGDEKKGRQNCFCRCNMATISRGPAQIMMENNSLSIETTATTRRRVSIGQAALIIVMATLAARVFGLFRGSLF